MIRASGMPRWRKNWSSPAAWTSAADLLRGGMRLELLELGRRQRLEPRHPLALGRVELLDQPEEGVGALAAQQHEDARIGREQQVGPDIPS